MIGEVGIGQELDLIGVPWFGAEDFKGKEPDMSKQGKVQGLNVGRIHTYLSSKSSRSSFIQIRLL